MTQKRQKRQTKFAKNRIVRWCIPENENKNQYSNPRTRVIQTL